VQTPTILLILLFKNRYNYFFNHQGFGGGDFCAFIVEKVYFLGKAKRTVLYTVAPRASVDTNYWRCVSLLYSTSRHRRKEYSNI
jgi:hypothetical protein